MLRWIVQIGIVGVVSGLGALAVSLLSAAGASRFVAIGVAVLIAVPVGALMLSRYVPPPGPPINDVTTDLVDPPRFEAVLAVRPPSANAVEHAGAAAAARQREAYPEVRPIVTTRPPQDAFRRALAVAEEMGWRVVAQDAGTGVIEAVDTTALLRFKDDIVVRVRPDGEGSRVDVRSLSRVGRSDLGKNAARIMEFSERFSRA